MTYETLSGEQFVDSFLEGRRNFRGIKLSDYDFTSEPAGKEFHRYLFSGIVHEDEELVLDASLLENLIGFGLRIPNFLLEGARCRKVDFRYGTWNFANFRYAHLEECDLRFIEADFVATAGIDSRKGKGILELLARSTKYSRDESKIYTGGLEVTANFVALSPLE